MQTLRLKQAPVARTGMLLRKPVAEVFEAFVNPDIATKFWFTKSSGEQTSGHFVRITNAGFTGDGDALVKQATDSTQGFSFVLAGLKALLEHDVRLNLVADRFPKGIEDH